MRDQAETKISVNAEGRAVRAPFCMTYLVGNSHIANRRGIGKNLHLFLHPNTFIDNLAYGGAKVDKGFFRTLNLVEKKERDFPTLNDSFVIVMIGDNDLRQGIEPKKVAEELIESLTRRALRNPRLKFFVCGILKSPSLNVTNIRDFNDKLRLECSNFKIEDKNPLTYIDLERTVAEARDIDYVHGPNMFLASDGIHLSPPGERLICRILASNLNPRIHKLFGNEATKILDSILRKLENPEYLEYIRMKGLYRKSYEDLLDKKRIVKPFSFYFNGNFYEREEIRMGGVFTNSFCGFRILKKKEKERRDSVSKEKTEKKTGKKQKTESKTERKERKKSDHVENMEEETVENVEKEKLSQNPSEKEDRVSKKYPDSE